MASTDADASTDGGVSTLQGSPPPNDSAFATRVAFPHTPDDFEQDPRVSFSKLENKYILENDDGSEWEWNDAAQRWIPLLDEALLEKQRQAYAVEGVNELEPAVRPPKKRKKGEEGEHVGANKKVDRKNTAIYVTSLPLDATIEEVAQVFSRCGVIAEEIDSGKQRIKLYHDEEGKFKGDALIIYFRSESVQLAIQLLDDTDFRLGEQGPAGTMRVKEADFSFKKQQERPVKSSVKDQRKIIKRTRKLNNKLADWDDDDPQALQDTSSRWDKVVVLKHMFTLDELDADPAAILDIKEDIREECSKLGAVTNVVLFDRETDGVATVRFSNVQAAEACVRAMDGRFFDGRSVVAYVATGEEKFKKKRKVELDDGDYEAADGLGNGKDESEDARLDQFGNWLEAEGAREGANS